MRILVDTNILLRFVEKLHVQFQLSSDAIDALNNRGDELIIVPQVLYEFWSVATRPKENNGLGLSPTNAHAAVTEFQQLFFFERDERTVYSIWEQLVSSLGVKGKQAHDARLAASMQSHAITHLLTFNTTHFARYKFVTALSPMDVVSGRV